LKVGALACRHRLHERLRFGEGLSYATVGDVDRLTTVALLETVSAIAADGHRPDDLRQAIATTRRAISSNLSVLEILTQWAYDELAGLEHATVGAMLDRIEAIEARDVAAAVARVISAAVLVVPCGCEPSDQRFRPYVGPTADVLRGRTFHKQRQTLLSFGPRVNYIAINQDGVTLVDGQGQPTTVYFNRCVGMLKFGDGERHLLGQDAQTIQFIRDEWPDRHEIGTLLDAAVPDEHIIWCSY
jgi:hypothetical protein